MSREQIVRKISSRSQNPVINAINKLKRKYGPERFRDVFKAITADNGGEFLDIDGIAQSVDKQA
jgi:IS30 family transposase